MESGHAGEPDFAVAGRNGWREEAATPSWDVANSVKAVVLSKSPKSRVWLDYFGEVYHVMVKDPMGEGH